MLREKALHATRLRASRLVRACVRACVFIT